MTFHGVGGNAAYRRLHVQRTNCRADETGCVEEEASYLEER